MSDQDFTFPTPAEVKKAQQVKETNFETIKPIIQELKDILLKGETTWVLDGRKYTGLFGMTEEERKTTLIQVRKWLKTKQWELRETGDSRFTTHSFQLVPVDRGAI